MKFWQVVSWNQTEHMVEVAKTAEAVGFDGLILAEHAVMPKHISPAYPYSEDGKPPMSDAMEFADPLITFGATAAVTERMRFMTGVYLLGLRHPLEAAKEIATLAKLSNHRFLLGIGSGWLKEEYELLGVDFHRRGKRLNECIDIVRQLWSGETVTYQGEFFDFEAIQIRPYPDQAVPIMGGGTSPLALKRSAILCDGWYGPGNTVEELPALLDTLKRLREAAGLPWEGFEIVAPIATPLNDDMLSQLEKLGVHGVVNYPFLFGCGSEATLNEKCDYMGAFAQRFID